MMSYASGKQTFHDSEPWYDTSSNNYFCFSARFSKLIIRKCNLCVIWFNCLFWSAKNLILLVLILLSYRITFHIKIWYRRSNRNQFAVFEKMEFNTNIHIQLVCAMCVWLISTNLLHLYLRSQNTKIRLLFLIIIRYYTFFILFNAFRFYLFLFAWISVDANKVNHNTKMHAYEFEIKKFSSLFSLNIISNCTAIGFLLFFTLWIERWR